MLYGFQLEPGEGIDIYARVSSKGSVLLPLTIWQEDQFYEYATSEQKFHFFYYGSLAVIVLINLAISFKLREKVYLFYALSTLGYLLFFLTSRGYGHQLLFPNDPALNTQLFLSSMPLLALFSCLFARGFLRTQDHSPKMDLALRGMIYFEYFNIVASIVFDYNLAVKISALSVFAFFSVLFFAGPISWHAKRRAGRFFTIAWVPLTLGFVATLGRTSGHLPNNFLTEYAMQIGSGLEAFILTLALADRLYRERESKVQAQALSIQKDKQRIEAQNELSEAMMRDSITLLPNGTRFEWHVNNTIHENADKCFAICVAKVSRINDITRTLGVSSVEAVLSEAAKRVNVEVTKLPGVISLKNKKGEKDATFQLTGDTFGILVDQDVSKDNVTAFHDFIREISLPIEMDSLSLELEPRIGCALYPAHGTEATQLIRNAIVAMESSDHAHDQIGYYDNSLDIYSESRLTLMSDLKDALDTNRPFLNYQPKLDLKTDTVIGMEALVRWEHPKRGFVSPVEFIPLAEETGVIKKLTIWAIETAVSDLVSLRKRGYEGNISINISAKDLLSDHLAGKIEDILKSNEIDPSKIFLELTETAAMDEPEAGLEALERLTSMGLMISIDDFGTGYSSLSYLKQLPASEIKLDRSLIMDIAQSESSRLIVKAAIDMAHGLGYKVVAEGVEDEESVHILKDLNCDKLQGFWLCKPKPLEEIAEWLASR
jgi:EAL domain-containing protein (putative c-di-GMP-specific phosphodiesterase class I)/GGDEF domain-containing protein